MDIPIENQRVRDIINHYYKGNENQFSKDIGISQPRINRLFNPDPRSNKYPLVSFEIIQAITNKFIEINSEWLVTGNGSMLKNDTETKKGKISLDITKGRPFYDVDFTLGFEGVDNDISLNPEFNIDFPPANRDTVNWFRAKGNSMIGEINSGDYIALEEVKDFSWFTLGRVYGIVTKNGFRTIKRVVKSDNDDEYLLVSNNPNKVNYPDQAIPKEMIHKLFKVVYVIKDLDE